MKIRFLSWPPTELSFKSLAINRGQGPLRPPESLYRINFGELSLPWVTGGLVFCQARTPLSQRMLPIASQSYHELSRYLLVVPNASLAMGLGV